jgi:hypothetical protein
MNSNFRENQEVLANIVQRLHRISGGTTSLQNSRLASILRAGKLLKHIKHPKSLLAEADRFLNPSSEGRLDDGKSPSILILGESKNEVSGFECGQLILAEDLKLREAGLQQLERTITQNPILESSIDHVLELLSNRSSIQPEYWNKAVACFDILETDPFWQIAKINQFAFHHAIDSVKNGIRELITKLPARADLAILNSNSEILFKLENGQKVSVKEHFVPSWNKVFGLNESSDSINLTYKQRTNMPWKQLIELPQKNTEEIAGALPSITSEENQNYSQLLMAKVIAIELENRYFVSEVELVAQISWAISYEMMEAFSKIPDEARNQIHDELEELYGQKQFIALLWPRQPVSSLNRGLTFGFKRPWTLAALFLSANIPDVIRNAHKTSSEWAEIVSETLRESCIKEFRWPLKISRPGMPSSIAELTKIVGKELGLEELEQFGNEAEQVMKEFINIADFPAFITEIKPGDKIRLILTANYLSHVRSHQPGILKSILSSLTKEDWLKKQLESLEGDWLTFLEPLIEALSDPDIDTERQLPWSLCNAALSLNTSEENVSSIVTTAIISAVREDAPNVTGILTSREARKEVRLQAQKCLRIMNEAYEYAPETIRARLRSHLQYLGWIGR